MRFLLLGNGTSHNRGCEAIRLATTALLRETFESAEIEVVDFGPRRRLTQIDGLAVRSIPVDRFSASWFGRHVARRLGAAAPWLPDLRRPIENADCVLSLGGDNFTCDYGSLGVHLDVLDYVAALGRPFVIWGASIGPFDRGADEGAVARRLERATAFLVREDISFEYLRRLGFQNVFRVDDPAFLLTARVPPVERLGFQIPAGAVGLNLSPLLARFCSDGNDTAWRRTAADIVRAAAEATQRPIVLVCHVMTARSNDYEFLSSVAASLQGSVPVVVTPPTLSSAEYKGVISRLSCFAGARTHATIAAFSTAVPTICLAYSTKGRGIARAIMGTDQWTLSGGEISARAISSKLVEILDREQEIRAHLEARIPRLRQGAANAGTILRSVLDQRTSGTTAVPRAAS